MISSHQAFNIKSITVLMLGAVMFFSCKTDIKEINAIGNRDGMPEMSGNEMVLFYSDSACLKYKVITAEYNKYNKNNEKYDEFPKGIHAELYAKDGTLLGSITSKYAKKLEEEMLWELRNEVVAVNTEGKKLETDLMYWDMKKEIIYSDRYTRLTSGEQIIEGNNGFESDQQLHNPVFKRVTGVVEIENRP